MAILALTAHGQDAHATSRRTPLPQRPTWPCYAFGLTLTVPPNIMLVLHQETEQSEAFIRGVIALQACPFDDHRFE